MIDFERRRLRSWIEARLLDAGDDDDAATTQFKAATIADLRGDIVEIGPGTGVNLRHYSPGTHVIAIEPNPVMRERLATTVEARDASPPTTAAPTIEIRDGRGESLDLATGSADGVVGTLLLCGVDDPVRVVEEVRRVLRPGGRYVFVEHVAAPAGSPTARLQRLVRRPHRWMFNGCRTDHDAEGLLRSFEWSELEVRSIDLGRPAAYVRHQIVGVATR